MAPAPLYGSDSLSIVGEMGMLFEDEAMNALVDALDHINALLRECSRIDGLARPLNERTVDLIGQVLDWLHTTPTPGEIASTRDKVRALRAEVEEFVAM